MAASGTPCPPATGDIAARIEGRAGVGVRVGVAVGVGVSVGCGVGVHADAVMLAIVSGEGPQAASSRIAARGILNRTRNGFMVLSFSSSCYALLGLSLPAG
jgi:hypothetical protein